MSLSSILHGEIYRRLRPWRSDRLGFTIRNGCVWLEHPSLPIVADALLLLQTRLVHVATRQNPVVNRLSKTRTIASADTLFAEKEAHLAELRQKAREKAKEVRKEEERVKRERKEEKWKREHAYDELMSGEGGRSNEEGWDEEDFM